MNSIQNLLSQLKTMIDLSPCETTESLLKFMFNDRENLRIIIAETGNTDVVKTLIDLSKQISDSFKTSTGRVLAHEIHSIASGLLPPKGDVPELPLTAWEQIISYLPRWKHSEKFGGSKETTQNIEIAMSLCRSTYNSGKVVKHQRVEIASRL